MSLINSLDMSLDDLITKKKASSNRGGRTAGRGGARGRGRGTARGGATSSGIKADLHMCELFKFLLISLPRTRQKS